MILLFYDVNSLYCLKSLITHDSIILLFLVITYSWLYCSIVILFKLINYSWPYVFNLINYSWFYYLTSLIIHWPLIIHNTPISPPMHLLWLSNHKPHIISLLRLIFEEVEIAAGILIPFEPILRSFQKRALRRIF